MAEQIACRAISRNGVHNEEEVQMFTLGMPGTRRDPVAELRQMQSQLNRVFDSDAASAGGSWPPVNLWLGDDSVVATAEMPGVAAGDIDVTVRENTLVLSGQRAAPTREEGATWHRRERRTGSFSRSIRLPLRVDPAKVDARMKNGVLEIEMGRPDIDRPRKIEVKSA